MNIASLSGVAKVAAALAGGGVLAGVIALGATGSSGGGPAPPAQVVEATPTSVPETTVLPRTTQVVPRTDCAPNERAYDDPDGRFSLCYPDSARASAHQPRTGAPRTVLTLREPPDTAVTQDAWIMRVTWDEKTGLGLGMPSAETCPRYTGTVAKPTSTQFVQVMIDGRTFTGCLTKGNLSPGHPQLEGQELMLLAPVAKDGSASEGYILIFINSTGPDLQSTSQRSGSVVDQLRVR
jgi:hypothetical protein